jgi:hypothetical protein
MMHTKILLASLLAASSFAATSAHAVNWVGTADYKLAASSTGDEDFVGPFDTYDQAPGVVLLKTISTSGTTVNLDGYYQSYISGHQLAGATVAAPKLNDTYELTMVANFTESVDSVTGAITVNNGGTFDIYLDTTPDRSFAGDSGFTNGDKILSGDITGGVGTSITVGSMIFGVTDISIAITSFDANVYEPDTMTNGGGIYTLRLGSPYDVPLLSSVTHVQGHSVDAGDFLFAADGYTALAVPEAETYAMMLAGLGLVGFMARRRARTMA